MTLPNVTFHQLEGGAYAVFMHLEQKVRTIFTQSLDAVHNRIVAVGVSEFGLPADAAGDLAAAAVAAHGATQDQTDHVALLQEELTQAQADVARLTVGEADAATQCDRLTQSLDATKATLAKEQEDRATAEAALVTATAEIARLNEALAKASPADAAPSAPAPSSAPETKATQ